MVTGGAGFIGSHLVDRLVAEGWDVLVIDDLSTGTTGNVNPQARLEVHDVAAGALVRLFRAWGPHVVFHLAAQASVPQSIRDPLRDLAVNVVGTHRVSTASGRAGVQRLVFVSSAGAVYGECRNPATERTCPSPTSYYGIHKLAAEGHVRLAGVPYSIARLSNVYGPRQAPGLEGAVIASFVAQAFGPTGFVIHGDGSQSRDFIHVLDTVEALWLLGVVARPESTWNVASGDSVSVLTVAEFVERSVGHRVERAFGPLRPGDIRRSTISVARLKRLGWERHISLSDGIAELVQHEALRRPGRASTSGTRDEEPLESGAEHSRTTG